MIMIQQIKQSRALYAHFIASSFSFSCYRCTVVELETAIYSRKICLLLKEEKEVRQQEKDGL